MLLYRGESRFDLKGTAPVKLPLILNGQDLISCLVESRQAKPSWRNAGELEQFAFLPELGNTVLRSQTITFGNPQLFELVPYSVSYLRFAPVAWLRFRTNIIIKEIEFMSTYSLSGNPIPVSSVGKNALVPVLATVTALVSTDLSRLSIALQNLGTKTVYVGFTNAVTAASYAIAIPANTAYEFPATFTGALWAISASGTNSVNVVEMSI